MSDTLPIPAPAAQIAPALATLDPKRYAAEVFEPFHAKLQNFLAASEAITSLAGFDIGSRGGMEAALQLRAHFRDEIRIAGDKARAEFKAPLLTMERVLDAEYKALAAAARPHEEYWDRLIKAEEERKLAEKAARIAAERARIERIRHEIDAMTSAPLAFIGADAATVAAAIQTYENMAVGTAEFEEFAADADAARTKALAHLRALHATALAAAQAQSALEAERAELARRLAEHAPEAATQPPAQTYPAPVDDLEPSNDEILANYVEAFGGTTEQACARLVRLVFELIELQEQVP